MSIITPMVRPMVRPMVTAMGKGGQRTPAQIIQGLFAQGQQGFWLPFTDFASLSQDSAGTLPYTALEQPVGRVLDRSGRGNHATQPTSTARGAVSARVNLLVKSEDFTSAPWSNNLYSNWIIAPTTTDAALAPNGAMTADLVMFTHNVHNRMQRVTGLQPNATYRFSVFMMAASASNNYGSGLFLRAASGNSGALVSSSLASRRIEALINDLSYTRVTLDITIPPSGVNELSVGINAPGGGTINASVFVWGASLVRIDQSSLPYQRVNTPTDYDAVGFPKYARLDGVDDFYTCGGGGSTTGFYYSDVIRPMGGAGTRRVIWSDRSGNNGYELAINTSDKLEFSAGNGTAITTVASTVSATVADGKQYEVMDDGTNLSVQIDGSAPVTVARPVVAAGSSTITLYRGASTGYFNGQVTEPIYRAGPPPSAYERGVIRAYQMQKAGL